MIVLNKYKFMALPLSILLSFQSSFATKAGALTNDARRLSPEVVRLAILCQDDQSLAQCENDITAALQDASYYEIVHRLKLVHAISVSIDSSDVDLLSNFDVQQSKERYPMSKHGSTKILNDRRLQTEQTIPYGINMVQAPEFWEEYGVKGQGVKVCIIDSGIDREHEDVDYAKINGTGINYPTTDWWNDSAQHGTHVSGVVAAQDNSMGVVGVAPEADIFLVKYGYDIIARPLSDDFIFALEACFDAEANIINISLGGYDYSSLEARAMKNLFLDHNTLLVASCGNEGSSQYDYPSSYDYVLSIAAVNFNGDRALFSNYNDQVNLAAPGVDVLSTIPGNQYGLKSGTSMASPHVAGVGALMMSRVGTDVDVKDIVRAMEQTAYNQYNVGYNEFYGHGLVKAVDAMKRLDFMLNHIEFELYLETGADGNETSWSLIDHTTETVIESGDSYESDGWYLLNFTLDAHRCYTWVIHSGNTNGFSGYYDIKIDDESVKDGFDFLEHDSYTFGNCHLVELVIKLETDSNASELRHSLRMFNADQEIWSDYNLENFETYTTTIPVDYSICYKYEITDSGGDGIAPDGNLRIYLDKNLLVSRGDFGVGGIKSIGSCH